MMEKQDKNFKWKENTFDCDFNDITNNQRQDFNIDEYSLNEQIKERYKQDTKYRMIFSVWVIVVVSSWLLAAMTAVYLQGFNVMKIDGITFRVFLATTTINVIGLAYIVLKGMFPQNNGKEK